MAKEMEWDSRVDTYLKVSEESSKRLAEDDKQSIPRATRLRAKLVGESANHFHFFDATLDGVPVPPHIQFAYTEHWESVSNSTQTDISESSQISDAVPSDGCSSQAADWRKTWSRLLRVFPV